MNKLKSNYPCDIKHWILYFVTIIFPLMQKNRWKDWMAFQTIEYLEIKTCRELMKHFSEPSQLAGEAA